MSTHKPEGYNSVSPYFVVEGAGRFFDFLENVFGATALRRYDGDGGKIVHAEAKVEDSVIMFADATEQWPANKLLVHVYVKDVAGVYERAVSYGCTPIQEPKQQEGDPDKRGMFSDFSGNSWAVSTQV